MYIVKGQMVEKKTTGKKREVVEMMLTGADLTSLITDRMKWLYENNRTGRRGSLKLPLQRVGRWKLFRRK